MGLRQAFVSGVEMLSDAVQSFLDLSEFRLGRVVPFHKLRLASRILFKPRTYNGPTTWAEERGSNAAQSQYRQW